jgi:hypothetical protein
MRCTNCGFPLSPSHKSCPRCGAAVNSPSMMAAAKTESRTPNQPFEQNTPFPVQAGTFSRLKDPPSLHTIQHRSTRFGFTIAGLFIVSGGLLLIFVYIMSLGLSSAAPSSQALQAAATARALNAAKLATLPSPSPTLQPTPASLYPAEQYVDNAQMASVINSTTALPLQLTTKFKVHQKIYVTFSLHPAHSGAVCLLWYLNNQQFISYQFPAEAVSISGYSYAMTNRPGSGYVEIYWASSTACADKMLAQQVTFTVSPERR